MSKEALLRSVTVVIILILQKVGVALGEFCGSDVYCYSPFTCCASKISCCYDRDKDYQYRVYKLQVWNMWYFWFIIIFILMSCFGGCGYYRRRRMAALARQQQHQQRSETTVGVSRGQDSSVVNYAYTGPDNSNGAFLPPPYTEVVSQPDLYPANKSELPPYPGAPIITANNPEILNAEGLMTGLPQPPPYSEVADTTCTSTSSREQVPTTAQTIPDSQPATGRDAANQDLQSNPAPAVVARSNQPS